MFGYRYIRPLTAPNGNQYTTETEQDMLDAIDAGDELDDDVRPQALVPSQPDLSHSPTTEAADESESGGEFLAAGKLRHG